MGKLSDVVLFFSVVSVDLPSVEQVVPYAVAASGNNGGRIEKAVSKPDGKDYVFLSKRLSCADWFAPFSAN